MAAIMISVDGINCENLSCNKRGVHIWAHAFRAHAEQCGDANGGQNRLPTLPFVAFAIIKPVCWLIPFVMSRYRRANIPGATYFFTVVTYRRRPILCDDSVRNQWGQIKLIFD